MTFFSDRVWFFYLDVQTHKTTDKGAQIIFYRQVSSMAWKSEIHHLSQADNENIFLVSDETVDISSRLLELCILQSTAHKFCSVPRKGYKL
jgi:hypothetical protein